MLIVLCALFMTVLAFRIGYIYGSLRSARELERLAVLEQELERLKQPK